MKKKALNIPFSRLDTNVPVLHFQYAEQDFYGVVDSGSEVTIFGKDIESAVNLSKNDNESEQRIRLVSLSGETVSSVAKTQIHIVLTDKQKRKCTIPVAGIFSDLSSLPQISDKRLSAIIGSDFLKPLSAKIDYETRLITLN